MRIISVPVNRHDLYRGILHVNYLQKFPFLQSYMTKKWLKPLSYKSPIPYNWSVTKNLFERI